jgi:hypothetical protein
MKTELVLFGRHIDMASQVRRQRLVVLVYGVFAALMAAGWFVDHWRVFTGMVIIIFCFLYRSSVLGGFGAEAKGLIKPFLGNKVRARYVKDLNSR